jgi:hypothetical protein
VGEVQADLELREGLRSNHGSVDPKCGPTSRKALRDAPS